MQEFPAFQEVYNKLGGEFTLLAIAADDRLNPQGVVTDNKYTWDFAFSPQMAELGQHYGFTGIPTTLFIDRNGNVVDQHSGGMDAADFESRLSKIL